MEQSHFGRDSLIWVQGSHSLQKINLQLIQAWRVVLHWDSSELGEGRLEVLQLESIWPVIFVRGSKHLEYLEDLINFTVAHEEWLLLSHFCKNTSGRPQVHTQRVMLLTQQNFRASIPQGNHLMGISLNWEAESSGQTEVGKLNSLPVLRNEKVLWLQISVENSVGMEEDERLKNLIEEALRLCWGQRGSLLFHVLFQIIL